MPAVCLTRAALAYAGPSTLLFKCKLCIASLILYFGDLGGESYILAFIGFVRAEKIHKEKGILLFQGLSFSTR